VSDDILSGAQRRDLAAYTSTSVDLNDGELLTRAAERMGMEGELAIDPEGVLELEFDGIIVVLESVAEEDRAEVEHPENLYLAVLLRASTDEERNKLLEADLVDEDAEPYGDGGDWLPAWWGSMCTRLSADASLSDQLEALNRVMHEAQAVRQRGELAGFFDRMAWLQLDDDSAEDEGERDDEVENGTS
jgi:hypothetical protein